MPKMKEEHCVTDTTRLLYDIAVTQEKILAALQRPAATDAAEKPPRKRTKATEE